MIAHNKKLTLEKKKCNCKKGKRLAEESIKDQQDKERLKNKRIEK